MSDHIKSAMNLLRIVRQTTDAIGVAVSFGKDSLATLDLCCRMFLRVEGYYLFRVRGMAIVDEWADDVLSRFGVRVRMYPHFDLVRCYRHAVLQPHWDGLDKIPRVKMADIEAKFRADAGVDWIAYGWRRNDSFSRALIMKSTGGMCADTRRVFPLRSWKRRDVYEYLAAKGIQLPDGLGRKDQGGLDFHAGALGRLANDYPDDYQRWLADFPFSGVQLATAESNDRGGENNPSLPETGTRKSKGRASAKTQANSRDGSTSQQAAEASS